MAYKLVDRPPPVGDASTGITSQPSSEPEPSSSTANYKKEAAPTNLTPRTSQPDHDPIHNI